MAQKPRKAALGSWAGRDQGSPMACCPGAPRELGSISAAQTDLLEYTEGGEKQQASKRQKLRGIDELEHQQKEHMPLVIV